MKLVPENMRDLKSLPAPPSLMRSFSSGFDTISNQLGLVLFPILLDLLLWWGPRLRLGNWLQGILADTGSVPELQTADMQDMLIATREIWLEVSSRFNLLTVLRTYPVGITSLMAGVSPVESPTATLPVWQLSGSFTILVWVCGLCLLGLAFGTLFYTSVSQAVISEKVAWGQVLREWPLKFIQVIALSLVWLAVFAAVSLPFSCMITLLALFGVGYSPLALLLYSAIMIWVLLPLAFSAHGIFINQRTMWASLKDGIRITRLTMPSTSLFLLAVVLLSQGLDIVWKLPAETSWMGLVGIAGHGFVTTGLLAASFVYYRDASRWIQQVFEKLQSVTTE